MGLTTLEGPPASQFQYCISLLFLQAGSLHSTASVKFDERKSTLFVKFSIYIRHTSVNRVRQQVLSHLQSYNLDIRDA